MGDSRLNQVLGGGVERVETWKQRLEKKGQTLGGSGKKGTMWGV